MLYRFLRQDEGFVNGLFAKNPDSNMSVVDHVTKGSRCEWKSQYISTCRSLDALTIFRSGGNNPMGQIVEIFEDQLPIEVIKIDLTTEANRMIHYPPNMCNHKLIYKFNNYADKFKEVLLVGHVPANCYQLLNV